MRDDKTADDVDHCENDGQQSQQRSKTAGEGAGYNQRSHDGDARNCVGAAGKRGVESLWHFGNHFKTDPHRQQENSEQAKKLRGRIFTGRSGSGEERGVRGTQWQEQGVGQKHGSVPARENKFQK